MNLKFEVIVQIFWKIIQLNVVSILKCTNEYYRKIISKCGRKMDLYPALNPLLIIDRKSSHRFAVTFIQFISAFTFTAPGAEVPIDHSVA